MKLKEYIKDELFKIILIIVYIILICGFLCAFNFGVQMAALMAVLAAIFFIIMFIWDFCRKRNFYNSLIDNTQRIDKKYLVIETLDEPEFYEGNLVYTAMYDINKSMIEHINQYERGQQDFKDFIEMWVHEIKLPIASLTLMCHNDKEHIDKKRSELTEQQIQLCVSVLKTTDCYDQLETLEKATPKQLLAMRSLRKDIRSTISNAFVDVMVNLKERYPTLTGDDVFYCVLSLLYCSKTVMMELMDATSDALKTRKNRIKNKVDAQLFERVFGADNQ